MNVGHTLDLNLHEYMHTRNTEIQTLLLSELCLSVLDRDVLFFGRRRGKSQSRPILCSTV